MGAWYSIGLGLGLGVGFGLVAVALVGVGPARIFAAVAVAAASGAAFGYPFGDASAAVAGAVGGVLGAFSGVVPVRGAVRRGATRLGVSVYLGAFGVLVLALAGIPLVGYAVTVAAVVLAVRMRLRQGARFAGLRTLAK
jgi:hypothetical protein